MAGVIIYAIKTSKESKTYNANAEEIVEHRITFSKLMSILLIGYAITLFSVRASDNVRMFNVLICMLFAYNYKLKDRGMIHEKRG